MRHLLRRLVPLAVLCCALPAAAVAAPLRLRVVATNVNHPIYVTGLPGHRDSLIVAQRNGKILRVSGGRKETFLDLRSLVNSAGKNTENGFLSLVFAPDYRQSRHLYVSYTTRHASEQLDEWTTKKSSEVVRKSSRRKLLSIPHPELHHFGGQLAFGPDRFLYMSTGDGGEPDLSHIGAAGQDLGTLLGKLLRIDPRPLGSKPYRVPPGNPFVTTTGVRPEIWAYGLRNPWRFSFDHATGALSIGDVGDETREEVDWLPHGKYWAGRGANLGWNCYEGSIGFPEANPPCSPPGVVFPVFEYRHYKQGHWPKVKPGKPVQSPGSRELRAADLGSGCGGSITGGYVVRDPQVEALYGRYVFGDFCSGNLYSAKMKQPHASVLGLMQEHPFQVASFGVDTCQRLYVVGINAGTVSRFEQGKSSCR